MSKHTLAHTHPHVPGRAHTYYPKSMNKPTKAYSTNKERRKKTPILIHIFSDSGGHCKHVRCNTHRCTRRPSLSLPERLADFELTCKTEAATDRWKKKDDTNREVNLPTTHGQREGSLVRPFMSERQRKNSLPDTRSRGGEG